MIESITFTRGYPTKLRGIGKKTITLNPRLNVLYGPNGAGKTTILHALARAAGCSQGGWSGTDDQVHLDALAGQKAPSRQITLEEPPYSARILWDGRPVFYQDCYADTGKSLISEDYLERHAYLRSSGEQRIGLVNELINFMDERFLTYKLPRDARPTLLLDEVDNHIGMAAQSVFWDDIISQLCKKYQLVISTHSIFPLLLQRDNSLRRDTIHMLEPRYGDICLEQLGKAIEYYNRQHSDLKSPGAW
ncbi:ATP-binding cassette domain-containing protein [Spirochaeta lutea]|uniref:AAA+ ATPase domain-containing protein n=1 Tax=Spirochaeta lutea TaxID=1480694 RepID=A0A098QZ00_9SPIO|nr:ABC transporter ATP-binding protein [Spirochaeta lutea]KGE72751.1 hypothetical protein DC28_05740 [Spirochaeta lutea]